ncbi:hypothetical protein B0H14DRAFT_3477711 [Mycena olivaceomarginata]|nr:hypothetical protein B0H14DRAFT_3477711 [Mycena olivaceomarginata]
MPSHPDVRHFKNGLSMVSQWTGGEHKEMEKVFACLIAGHAAEPAVIRTAQAVIDFIYLASLESHTARSLDALGAALDTFHANKQIFLDLGVRAKQGHFNIPKLHSMEHYVAMIWLFGSLDGYNTESPERLHIDYAKAGYRASNKRDYIAPNDPLESLHLKPHTTVVPLPVVVADMDSSELVRVPKRTVLPVASTRNSRNFYPGSCRPECSCFPLGHYHIPPKKSLPLHPATFDRFDLFKRITVTLPIIPEASPLKIKNIVRASPPVSAVPGSRALAEPRLQDFALVRTGEVNSLTEGTALAGLRVAQVRVLFTMPTYYPAPFSTAGPLAYVEWFTPFSRPEGNSKLYVLRRSTRRQQPYGEIIDVDRIARNCFLVPRSERGLTDTKWTTENAKELCSAFYLNPHLDMHTFSLNSVMNRMATT